MSAEAGCRVIRVAVIEDEREIREGLGILINATPGFGLTQGYRTMESALGGLEDDRPDVVLLDLGLPNMDGIEGARLLHQRYPDLPVVVLTIYDDDERIFQALCAGACGYLLKNTPPARLLSSLEEVMEGGAPMSPEVARRVIELFRRVRPPREATHCLTPHEVRLLKLLVEGHNYKTAAQKLGVSVNTISFHMRHVYEKLQVHSKSQAVAKALQSGIVS